MKIGTMEAFLSPSHTLLKILEQLSKKCSIFYMATQTQEPVLVYLSY